MKNVYLNLNQLKSMDLYELKMEVTLDLGGTCITIPFIEHGKMTALKFMNCVSACFTNNSTSLFDVEYYKNLAINDNK